jgi:hypothetical protein
MRPMLPSARMRCFAAALICALMISFGATAQAAESTELPMLDCGGLPCLTVRLATGHSIRLLFDSGNAASILDVRKAKALGLRTLPYRTRAGQVVPGIFLAQISGARLGSIELPPTKFVVMDLGHDVPPSSDGSLAYVAFKDRAVTLDYRRRVITVSGPGAHVAAPEHTGTMTFPTFGKKGPPIVATTGFAVNGQPITVQVDTLYTGSLLIYPTSVAKLGVNSQAAATRRRRFPFTDGGVDMIEGRALRESFAGTSLLTNAPLYFATPQVHLPDGMFDGTVGAQLFAGHRVTFDFHANRFWIS